jgi:hypothetical protein
MHANTVSQKQPKHKTLRHTKRDLSITLRTDGITGQFSIIINNLFENTCLKRFSRDKCLQPSKLVIDFCSVVMNSMNKAANT